MTLVVSLSGAQTILQAEDTARLLQEALGKENSIALDCDGIEEADLTFVQLVMAARKSAERDGKVFGLAAPAKGGVLAALDSIGIRSEGNQKFWFEGVPQP